METLPMAVQAAPVAGTAEVAEAEVQEIAVVVMSAGMVVQVLAAYVLCLNIRRLNG